MPVRIIFLGMMRLTGLTDGVPMSIKCSVRDGLLSRGRPLPLNILPRSSSPLATRMGWPRNLTLSFVEMPLLPAKTCKYTRFPSSRMTCARETPRLVVIWAISLYPTVSASTVMTSPDIWRISVYDLCTDGLLCRDPFLCKQYGDFIFYFFELF